MKKPVIALYAGSFDPITNGHIDILRVSLTLAEKVILAIGIHPAKKSMLNFSERETLSKMALGEIVPDRMSQIEIVAFDGLLVNKARELGATFLIRGLRNGTDFDYEMQLAEMNARLAPELQTIFLTANPLNRSISSHLVRQIATMGGDISAFVPEIVAKQLHDTYNRTRNLS